MVEIRGRGDARPQGPKPLVLPVLIVPPGPGITVVVISDSWVGMHCHWYKHPREANARTILCTAPDECPCLSEPDVPNKWHCYMPVVRLSDYRLGVLSLTDDGLTDMIALSQDEISLRGSVWDLKRATEHKSSRVIASRSERRYLRTLLERFSIRGTLDAVYGERQLAAWSKSHPDEDFIP